MKDFRIGGLGFLLVWLGARFAGQPTAPLTLQQALAMAGAKNPTLLSDQQHVIATKANEITAGFIDVATFGGTTRQYQAEVDPHRLLAMGGVTMTQVVNAVRNSNANAGGNYLTLGKTLSPSAPLTSAFSLTLLSLCSKASTAKSHAGLRAKTLVS